MSRRSISTSAIPTVNPITVARTIMSTSAGTAPSRRIISVHGAAVGGAGVKAGGSRCFPRPGHRTWVSEDTARHRAPIWTTVALHLIMILVTADTLVIAVTGEAGSAGVVEVAPKDGAVCVAVEAPVIIAVEADMGFTITWAWAWRSRAWYRHGHEHALFGHGGPRPAAHGHRGMRGPHQERHLFERHAAFA